MTVLSASCWVRLNVFLNAEGTEKNETESVCT